MYWACACTCTCTESVCVLRVYMYRECACTECVRVLCTCTECVRALDVYCVWEGPLYMPGSIIVQLCAFLLQGRLGI